VSLFLALSLSLCPRAHCAEPETECHLPARRRRRSLAPSFDKQYENHPEAVANPLELLERIGRLQAQLPKLQADCAEIAAAKAELRDSTTATMVANRRSIAYGAPLPRLAAVTRTSTRVRQF
jgi:hypothetical protein